MADEKSDQIAFEGEEAASGFGSPALDLIASVFLIVLSLAFAFASLSLPVPGDLNTAPGLLPFIVAASLLLMAVGLGASALARRRAGESGTAFADRDLATDLRSLLLAGTVAVYILALQQLAFQQNFSAFGQNLRLTAFEPVTVIALSTIIHFSWRGPVWITTSVAVTWTVILSLVFQIVFRIPLPGTF